MPEPEQSPVDPSESGEENPIVKEDMVQAEPTVEDGVPVYPETYDASPPAPVESGPAPAAIIPATTGGGGGEPPVSGGGGDDGSGGGDEDEEQMAKMSFLEHLEELRKRLIRAVLCIAVAFFVCWFQAERLFGYMSAPIRRVLRERGLPEQLVYTHPTDSFTLYLDLALVASLFVASPFVLGQVWGFISPGLYKREKRYAVPFVSFCTALFIAGGAFGYFIAFPYALKFLLNFGGPNIRPMITINEYMSMFWTVMLGLALLFELPVLMMFLGLLGIVTPKFLLNNFRYAVLLIFIIAAIITPTPDVMTMMIFATPMLGLYVLGIGLVWLVRRKRDRRIP